MDDFKTKLQIWLINQSYDHETTLFRVLYDQKYRYDYYQKAIFSALDNKEFNKAKISTVDCLYPERKIGNNMPYEETLYIEHYMRLKLSGVMIGPFLFSTALSWGLFLLLTKRRKSIYNKLFIACNQSKSFANILNVFSLFLIVANLASTISCSCLLSGFMYKGIKLKYFNIFDFERNLKLKYLNQIRLYRELRL